MRVWGNSTPAIFASVATSKSGLSVSRSVSIRRAYNPVGSFYSKIDIGRMLVRFSPDLVFRMANTTSCAQYSSIAA